MERTTKEQTLAMLEENRGQYVSGAAIGASLNVTRAAVWKAVRTLRSEGYEIDAVTNRGYGLLTHSDRLHPAGIRAHLHHSELQPDAIRVRKVMASTNQDAKALALEGAAHGTVVLAEEQTAGRGRLGRSFHSPRGTGLYMSLVLRPSGTLETAVAITQAAAVAVCRALRDELGIEAKIKWVNDLYVGGRKICGILTEGVSDMESGQIEALVLGIGLNLEEPADGFPREIAGVAGALFPTSEAEHLPISRNRLAAAILDRVLDLAADLSDRSFLVEYRERCFLLDQPVWVTQGEESYDAVARAIDDDGALLVETNGELIRLRSGEVSVRTREE